MRRSIVPTDPASLMSDAPVRSARRASFTPALGTPTVSVRASAVQPPAVSQATAPASRRDRVRVASRKALDVDDVAGTSPIPRRDHAIVFPPSPSSAAVLSSGSASAGKGSASPSPGRRAAVEPDIELAIAKPGRDGKESEDSGGKTQYDGDAGASSEATGYAARQQRLVRLGFIRKVYAVLTAQLLLTFAVVCLVTFVDALRVKAQTNTTLLWIALGTTLTCMILLACWCVD